MDKQLIEMKRRFDEKLNKLASQKGQNTQYFTESSYKHMIQRVKSSKKKVANKRPEDYQRLRRFDVMSVGPLDKLIVPVKNGDVVKFYVHKGEIFHILHDTHLTIGHGGRNLMEKEVNFRYKNITREMVIIYLTLCEECAKKRVSSRKGFISKPVLGSEMDSRCQVDLIEMECSDNNEYKFILVYQDHLTKFVQLRPLKSNNAEEVAYVLLDIFTIFGAPNILQSDNGREFAAEIAQKVRGMWPEVKIVHGKSESQSQESGDENPDVESLLSAWLKDNSTVHWSEGLRFVQLMKNTTYHAAINGNPHEAMFGTKVKLALRDSFIPQEALSDLHSEEDLEKVLINEDLS